MLLRTYTRGSKHCRLESPKKLYNIRDEICNVTCYKLLLKAKLEEDDGLIDLTGEEEFTMSNTSKEQLARVGMQAFLVSSIYASSYYDIERMRKKQSTHRNIMEVDRNFVQIA